MGGPYKIITLCGSTRFKDAFMREQKRLTLEGNIVISVGLFGHSGDKEAWLNDGKTKKMLDDMHKKKIDMADSIFIINEGGYIGESTKNEIRYARKHGKPVEYLEPRLYCDACQDEFLHTSVDGQYIERYGMCSSCFNYFDGLYREMYGSAWGGPL